MLFQTNIIFMLIKTVGATICTLGMMIVLTEFKYKMPKVLFIFLIYLIWVSVSTFIFINLLGWQGFLKIFLLTISVPAVLLVYLMAKDDTSQAIFNYMTQINISILLLITGTILNTAVQGNEISDLIIRTVLYISVIWLEWHFFRKPFRIFANTLKGNWTILSLIPTAFCGIILICGIFPVHFLKDGWAIVRLYGIAATMFIVYFVVFESLQRRITFLQIEKSQTLLNSQVSVMEKQNEAILRAEENLSILRHDLRHYTRTIEGKLREGHIDQVFVMLSQLEGTLQAAQVEIYCDNLTVNAAISPLLTKAKNNGIKLCVEINLPAQLRIDNIEFAVAISNALENAVNACLICPDKAEIQFLCNHRKGQLAVEISNTCNSPVIFGYNNIPISSKGGLHGIGVLSISAFAERHKAFLNFDYKENIFTMRLLVNDITNN